MTELETLKAEIATLRRGREGTREKPHKLVLLLAVLDLAEAGLLERNEIHFDDALHSGFSKYFERVQEGDDMPQMSPPFFHLRSAEFWRHKIKPGRQSEYDKLTTAGGGTKRIHDNIEYAYLSEELWRCVRDTNSRAELRRFIIEMFPPESASRLTDNSPRLSTVFHESFSLSRPALQQVLAVLAQGGANPSSTESLRSKTSLGINAVKAARSYARGVGLCDSQGQLTPFGSTVAQGDPHFNSPATMWMLHYYLCAPHGKGPLFWNHLSSKYLATEEEFTREEIAQELATLEPNIAADTLKTTATVFLGTYAKADALGPLGLLEEVERGRYRAREDHAELPPGALACALGDFWSARFGDSPQVNLAEVSGSSGLAPIFFLSKGSANRALASLQSAHLVALHTLVPPYQIAREWSAPADLWPHLFSLGQASRADADGGAA